MIFAYLIAGLAFPTIIGWLLLKLTEWHSDVLFATERWFAGCLLGLTATMFVTFFANVLLGVPLTTIGYLGVQGTLALLLGGAWLWLRPQLEQSETVSLPPITSGIRKPALIMLGILAIWTVTKILVGGFLLTQNPIYLDDTIDNWNFRGKIFYTEQTFVLQKEIHGGIESYPPTVSMAKAMLASVYGEWNEGLVNVIHVVWFICALVLLYYALRRHTSFLLAAIGTYMLANLPLYLIQGTNTYADVFVSGHVLLAISFLFHALTATSTHARMAFLRLSAVSSALLIFTKNEGFGLYAPGIAVVLAGSLFFLWKRNELSTKELVRTVCFWLCAVGIVVLPWIGYKALNGLAFGNAKNISSLAFGWQESIIEAMTVNTFFEGNWIFLFPLLIVLLVWRYRAAFASRLSVITAFTLLIIGVQCFLFMFTSLSVEALYQTGFARGFTHLMPLLVLLTMLLITDATMKRKVISNK
jgi:hypothetical protein